MKELQAAVQAGRFHHDGLIDLDKPLDLGQGPTITVGNADRRTSQSIHMR